MASSFLITEVIEASATVEDKFDALDEFDESMSCISDIQSIAETMTAAGGSLVDPKKYFGLKARDEFGARSRWLMRQRQLTLNVRDLRDKMSSETALPGGYESDGMLSDDDLLDPEENGATTRTITSPRTKYIASCLNDRINPRMSLIVRKRVSPRLNMQHLGMGDSLGRLFADAIRELPYIDSINLSDNNLCDKSLGPIITSITKLPTVTFLDLSNNDLDRKSAAALANYLHTSGCPLQRLILQKSDIDDDECLLFVAALSSNNTLQELDLTSNIVGQTETLNMLQPDLVTGGEALAELLSSNMCILSTLRLGWNMIRLDGGIALADCLAVNTTLTHLDLSYNTLGKDGAEHLGSALLLNGTLKTLLLVNNNINFSGCFAICVGIEENFGLRTVQLDGNPIGEEGARILMQIPFTAGNRVNVTAAGCNLLIRDVGCKFNSGGSPVGFYELCLDRPYERAICIKLLRLVASYPSFSFCRCAYDSRPARPTSDSVPTPVTRLKNPSTFARNPTIPSGVVDLVLKSVLSPSREDHLDDGERILLKKLRDVENATVDAESARELFRQYDTDGSGALDRHEVRELVKELGLPLEGDGFDQAMDCCDVDNSGELDEDEFLAFIRYQKENAAYRIKDLTECSIMVTDDKPNVKYVPPCEGTMYMQVADNFSYKTMFKVVNAVDHSNMMEVIRNGVDSVSAVLEFCIQHSYLRLREARYIYAAMFKETRDSAIVLSKILPRMAYTEEAKHLMLQYISFDMVALRNLQLILGNALRPILGYWNGYYSLDLSNKMDRLTLIKILVKNESYQSACRSECVFDNGTTGDLSQRGDWSGFRNAVINGTTAQISADLFKPIPIKGHVSFDFCGDDKAPKTAVTIKDQRCVNLIINLGLVQCQLKPRLQQDLRDIDELNRSSVHGNGLYCGFNDPPRAENIQECMCKFYDRLLFRTDEHVQARILEDVNFSPHSRVGVDNSAEDSDDSDNDSTDSLSHVVFNESESELLEKQTLSIDLCTLDLGTVPLSRHPKYQRCEYRRENSFRRRGGFSMKASQKTQERGSRDRGEFGDDIRQQFSSVSAGSVSYDLESTAASSTVASTEAAETTDSSAANGAKGSAAKDYGKSRAGSSAASTYSSDCILKEGGNDINVKAMRITAAFVDILYRVYIRAKHLAVIAKCFFLGRHHRTRHFGSYRVELIVALFSRVVDLHNFDLVLRVLQPYEHAHVLCRLGILQVFNPMKPEGSICLNMSRREEREVVKMLVVLKTQETGDNWRNAKFRWDFDAMKISGWELTQPWLRNESLPYRGFLSLTYCSGDGWKKNGCVADVSLRKSLLSNVRIDEADLIADEDNIDKKGMKIHLKEVGAAHALNNKDIWFDLLAPENSSSARLAHGVPFFDVFADAPRYSEVWSR